MLTSDKTRRRRRVVPFRFWAMRRLAVALKREDRTACDWLMDRLRELNGLRKGR